MISVYPNPLQVTDSLTGGVAAAISHHEMQVVVDYADSIGLGALPNHEQFRGFGRRDGLTSATAGDDLWEVTPATVIVYPDQSVGEQMTFVSTSATDSVAGGGVETIDLHYLDAAGDPQHEILTLTGTTPVNTVATDIRFVQYMHSSSVTNFGGLAGGDITIYRTGDATRIYDVIKANGNMTLNAARMVPNGKTFYLKNLVASAASSKPMNVRFRATTDIDGTLTPGIFIFNEIFELQNSGIPLTLAVPRAFPAFTIIKGTAYSSQAGGAASLGYGGFIE